jgi:hypothetical protein
VTAPVGRPPSRAREPQPQGIRGLQLRIDAFRGVADTFGTFNKPVGPIRNTAYAAPAARPTDRCRSRALAALAASGTRGLPASAAPSVFRMAVRVVSSQRVGRSAVVPVERAVDPEMLGIGYLLPGSPRRASLGDGRSRVPCRECCHRVRFLSDRRTSTLRQTRSARCI